MNQLPIQTAIARLLRPLVRILIRHGVSYSHFSEVAKRVYVEVADQDFPLEGRKQTHARIGMLTGVPRKEVARLKADVGLDDLTLDLQYNRGVRVTGGWRRDSDFQDEDGAPRALAFDGDNGFTGLARRYSGDLPPRAVLDEFVRVGTVLVDEQGLISLLPDAVHVPHGADESQINIMGNSGRDLLGTIDHNFESSAEEARLQLTVAYDNLPLHAVRRFQHVSHEECLQLLKRFDTWLAEQDRDTKPEAAAAPNSDRYRAGIGMYYFEEQVKI